MLYLDASLEIDGLTVFRDYNDPALFYYLPKSPQLATEAGQPMFLLHVYREDLGAQGVQGGGFLTMTVDLGVPATTVASVRSQLSSRFGVDAVMAHVPIEQGTVRVSLLGAQSGSQDGIQQQGPRFVETVLGATKPSLYGEERAAFSAQLTRQGAVAMKDAVLRAGASPVVVAYDLTYRGLMPAYHAKIVIKYHQSYQYLHNRAQMNTLWFKTDVDREMETLRKRLLIDIKEIDYQGVTDPVKRAEQAQHLEQLARELAAGAFFKAGLNPGAVLAQDRGAIAAYDASQDAKANTEGFTTVAQAATTGVRDASQGPPLVQGAAARPGRFGADEATARATATTATPAAQEQRPPSAVEAWNRAGRPQGAFLLRELSQTEDQEITFNLLQISATTRTIAPQGQIRLMKNATALAERVIETDLNSPFFQAIEGTVSTSADLEQLGVAKLVVKLRYGERQDGTRWKDTAEFALEKAGDKGSFRFLLDRTVDLGFEYQVVVFHKPDFAIGLKTSHEEGPWLRTTTRNLDIDPRDVSSMMRLDLQLASVDWATIQSVTAAVEYKDPSPAASDATTKLLTQAAARQSVTIRPSAPGAGVYTVTARFRDLAGNEDVVVVTGKRGGLVVLNQPLDRTFVLDLTLQDPLDRYARISASVFTNDPTTARPITLTGNGATGTYSFRRVEAQSPRWRAKVTRFLKNGSVREDPPVESGEHSLILGDVAPDFVHVSVFFLGELRSAGWRAMRLKLACPDAPSWAESRIEKVFVTGAETFEWRVPVSRVGANAYTAELTWIGSDPAHNVHVGPVTLTQETLMIDPLAPEVLS
ncbi:MAG: hypothetical protein U0326_21390 [Polyangiales bacterium]